MKSTAVACALMLLTLTTSAQEVARLYASADRSTHSSISLDRALPTAPLPGYRLRNVGAVLTLGGLSLVTGGLIVMNSGGPRSTHPNVTGDEVDWHEPLGFMMTYAGVGMTVPGIILWRKGARKYKRSLEREGLAVTTNGAAVALNYSF